MQVLANPSSELQEGKDITREMLRERGIRPYDEKVPQTSIHADPYACCRTNHPRRTLPMHRALFQGVQELLTLTETGTWPTYQPLRLLSALCHTIGRRVFEVKVQLFSWVQWRNKECGHSCAPGGRVGCGDLGVRAAGWETTIRGVLAHEVPEVGVKPLGLTITDVNRSELQTELFMKWQSDKMFR